jgi:4-phytase / acid phosphatase
MNLFRRMVVLLGLVLTLTIIVPVWVSAQTITDANDGTTLKQIIIFGRHSIRSSTQGPSELRRFAVDPYPSFHVQPGYLTPRGRQAEILLGTYYRDYLLHEGLLTGNDRIDAERSYFRSNSIERSYVTAHAFGTGLIPHFKVGVHSYALGHPPIGQPDPVFDPILTGVVKEVDTARAATEAQALFNSGRALASAYSGEYSLIRSVLFDYSLGTQPPPPKPSGKVDPTAQKITLTANTTPPLYTGGVIDMGGLHSTIDAADPFVMQYADGFPLDQVAWGRLTLDQLSQQTRLISLQFNIEMLSPYLNKVQSSNAASHVLRTMEQAVIGDDVPGAFGDAGSRSVVIISSDAYVVGLAGLLHAHWQLPGYQPDFCPPGGALVFELRQSRRTKAYLVRVFYTAQTFDQLRNLTPLTLKKPPATIQLLIPGGSKSATNLDVDFGIFQRLMRNAIDPKYVEDPSEEVPPGVLPGVPAQ